jgi:hypothetical protein
MVTDDSASSVSSGTVVVGASEVVEDESLVVEFSSDSSVSLEALGTSSGRPSTGPFPSLLDPHAAATKPTAMASVTARRVTDALSEVVPTRLSSSSALSPDDRDGRMRLRPFPSVPDSLGHAIPRKVSGSIPYGRNRQLGASLRFRYSVS